MGEMKRDVEDVTWEKNETAITVLGYTDHTRSFLWKISLCDETLTHG